MIGWKRPIFKVPFSRNSKGSVWNTNFFTRRAIAKIAFVLHSTYKGDTPCQVWFNLDNFLTQSEIILFKIRHSQNSQNSVWQPIFFPRQAIAKIHFFLHFTYTGDTPWQVGFDLNSSLARGKKPIFKIPFSRNSKSSVWSTNRFTRNAIAWTSFVLYSTCTGDTPCQILFDFDNFLTQSKRIVLKIRYSRNSKRFVWNAYEILTFFLGELLRFFVVFCFSLYLHRENSIIPSLVWFEQLLEPMKKTYF